MELIRFKAERKSKLTMGDKKRFGVAFSKIDGISILKNEVVKKTF